MDLLDKGVRYKYLNKSIVIFICTFDMFKKGLLKYTFNSICNEDKDIVLDDGVTKVFVNASYSGNSVASDDVDEGGTIVGNMDEGNVRLRSLIKYINTGETSDEYTKKIDAAVISSRKHKSWRNEYMKYRADREDLLDIGREQGLEQGRGEERTKIIKKMLLLDMSYEEISEIVDMPVEEIMFLSRDNK